MKSAFVLVCMVLLGGGCYLTAKTIDRGAQTAGQIQMIKIQATVAAPPQSFEDHALDTLEDNTKAGYAAIVAVAASADVSQTKIAQAIPSSIWGMAVVFGMIAVILVVATRKPSATKSDGGSGGQVIAYDVTRQNDHVERQR